MIRNLIKRSILNRFDDYVDVQIYNIWLKRYEIIKKSGQQPFIPELPEKYFSQNDEDGYTLKILDRFDGLLNSFVEIGVGNGLENNSLILKANGFKGIWIDAQDLPGAIKLNASNENFRFVKQFIYEDTINDVLKSELQQLKLRDFDVLSLDIDGDDFNVLKSIITHFRPKVIIAEVNSKLGPHALWRYSTTTQSTPAGDNFGASFATFKNALNEKRYKYLAMNAATGLNVFFIDEDYSYLFPELTSYVGFVPPFYRWPKRMLGNPSFELVNSILNG